MAKIKIKIKIEIPTWIMKDTCISIQVSTSRYQNCKSIFWTFSMYVGHKNNPSQQPLNQLTDRDQQTKP